MRASWVLVLLVLGVLQVRGDGYFPFDRTWPKGLLLGIVLFHLGLIWLILNKLYHQWTHSSPLPSKKSRFSAQTIWLLPPILTLIILAGQAWQAERFEAVGYRWEPGWLSGLALLAFFGQGVAWRAARAGKWVKALSWAWAGALTLKLYPLFAFPLTAKRSDMLPIIYEAGRAWLDGRPIYQYFMLDNGVSTQMVRLPGMIALYLPAVYFDLDLRWVLLFFESILFLSLALAIGRLPKASQTFASIVWLALAYLPYWHLRHELYEAPFWVVLLLSLYLLKTGRLGWAGGGLGFLAAMHQWAWVLAPFLGLYLLRREGLKRTLLVATGASAAGYGVLAFGVQGNWEAWQHHIFGYYEQFLAQGNPYLMALYLTALFGKLGLLGWLKPLQLIGVLGFGWAQLKRPARLEEALFFGGLALAWMLAFNVVAWTYQYLLVVFLLALALGLRAHNQD